MKKLTKKKSLKLISLVGLFVLLFIIWIIWDNVHIQTTHYSIEDEALPEAFDGFKVAQISDLHNKDWGADLAEILEQEQPDLIAITGDLIDSSTEDFSPALSLIESLTSIAPIYFVTGNHEAWHIQYDALEKSLIDKGITILDDQAIEIGKDSSVLTLMGIQDPAFSEDTSDTFENALTELADSSDEYTVLLSHRPERFQSYVESNVNIVLSGHAHGGQFRLPFIGGLVAPDQGLFPEYTAGVHTAEETSMIVSRGLGNSIIPIRFNNPPELVIVTLNH